MRAVSRMKSFQNCPGSSGSSAAPASASAAPRSLSPPACRRTTPRPRRPLGDRAGARRLRSRRCYWLDRRRPPEKDHSAWKSVVRHPLAVLRLATGSPSQSLLSSGFAIVGIIYQVVNRRYRNRPAGMTDAGMCCTESEVGKTSTLGEYVVTVTSKGRLTLPPAVRRRSGIEPGDRVVIVIEDLYPFTMSVTW